MMFRNDKKQKMFHDEVRRRERKRQNSKDESLHDRLEYGYALIDDDLPPDDEGDQDNENP